MQYNSDDLLPITAVFFVLVSSRLHRRRQHRASSFAKLSRRISQQYRCNMDIHNRPWSANSAVLCWFQYRERVRFCDDRWRFPAPSHMILGWSGYDPTVSALSTSNHLWLQFRSDASYNDAGFVAYAYAVRVAANGECGLANNWTLYPYWQKLIC